MIDGTYKTIYKTAATQFIEETKEFCDIIIYVDISLLIY